MNRDKLANVAMAIIGAVTVVVVVVGAAKDNLQLVLMGMVIGAYAIIIGTSNSVGRAIKKEADEIKDQIRDLRK